MNTENLSGKCGEAVNWSLDAESGVISITGCGPMTNYRPDRKAPWHGYREQIREIVIGEGVTTLGEYAFVKCPNLIKVQFSSTVDTVRFHGLTECNALTELRFPEGVRVLESRSVAKCMGLRKLYIPLSMKAIDFKALFKCQPVGEVVYAGTEEQWNKIRIGMAVDGCEALKDAERHYEGKVPEKENVEALDDIWFREKTEVVSVVEMAAEILKKGGDSKLHVLAINSHEDEGTWPKTGDCQFIIFPDGQLMMLDCGHRCGKNRVLSVAKQLGIKTLKYFLASHCHGDHVGNGVALGEYLDSQGGKIEHYYSSGLDCSIFEKDFIEQMSGHGTEMHIVATGDVLEIGGVRIEILGPDADLISEAKENGVVSEEINNLSVMTRFVYGDTIYLTTGDLFKPAEYRMIDKFGDQLRADVMKANHHGIATSSCVEWLDTVRPGLVYALNPEIGGTVLAENLAERNITYFTTGFHGDLLISMDAQKNVEAKTSYGSTYSCTAGEK